MRKEACDQINKMFGLNIDVEYREDYQEFTDQDLTDNVEDMNKKE